MALFFLTLVRMESKILVDRLTNSRATFKLAHMTGTRFEPLFVVTCELPLGELFTSSVWPTKADAATDAARRALEWLQSCPYT